jgi:hypothetical protein
VRLPILGRARLQAQCSGPPGGTACARMPAMKRFFLAIAAGALIAGSLRVMGENFTLAVIMWCTAGILGLWALVTSSSAVRMGRRLVPSFLRSGSTTQEPFGIWATVPGLGELFIPFLRPIRQIESEIAAISATYRPRIGAARNAGAGSKRAAARALRIGRRQARAINRCLDRLDPPTRKLQETSATIAQTLEGMEQRVRDGASDLAGLIVIHRDLLDLGATMKEHRAIDEAFRSSMVSLHGFTGELNATSARGAEIGARIIAAVDNVLGSSQQLLSTTDGLLNR